MNTTQSSVLGSLRALIPRTRCRFGQSLTVAERQAATLTRYLTSSPGQPSTPADERVAALPHIRVVREPLPVPSFSRWNGHDWIICLNCRQPTPRSRLALLHEFKHIIDYGHTRCLYTGTARCSAAQQAEQAADHFAAYSLVPPRALQRAWRRGIRHPAALARHFQVPTATVLIRLVQSRLAARDDTPSAAAHAPPKHSSPPNTARPHHSTRSH